MDAVKPNTNDEAPRLPRFGWGKSAVFCAVAAFTFFLSLVDAVCVPIGRGGDEIAHFDYAIRLAMERSLPAPNLEYVGQIQHPPLPYVVYAALFAVARSIDVDLEDEDIADRRDLLGRRTLFRLGHRIADDSPLPEGAHARLVVGSETRFWVYYLMRFPTLLLGVWTLILLLQSLRYLWPNQPGMVLLAVAGFAFAPLYSFQFATVGNDPWLTFLTTLAAWYALRARFRGTLLRRRTLLTLSVLIGAAFLTKLHAVGITTFLTLLVWSERGRGSRHRLLDTALLASGPLLLAGWWHVRQIICQGGLLALGQHADYSPQLFRLGEFHPIILLNVIDSTIRSFFALLGSDSIVSHPIYYLPVGGLAILTVFGALFLRPTPSGREDDGGTSEAPSLRAPLRAALISVGLQLGIILLANRSYYHLHGRYFFAALVPVLIIFLVGLGRLFGGRRNAVLSFIWSWNALFVVLTVFVIVLNRYTISLDKVERGRVLQYFDCGHPWFDQETGGAKASRSHSLLNLPSDTLRFAAQAGGRPEMVYRVQGLRADRRYQVRLRYPSPAGQKDVPAPTACALFADDIPVHGPWSLWGEFGELVFPLPELATADGMIALRWENQVPRSTAVACAELWVEEAWVQLNGPAQLSSNQSPATVRFVLENVDDREAHTVSVFLIRKGEVVARSEKGGIRLGPGDQEQVSLPVDAAADDSAGLRVHVVAHDQSPWASTKLAYWASPGALVRGLSRVPDIKTLRLVPGESPQDVMAVVGLQPMPPGEYFVGVTHPREESPLEDGAIQLGIDGDVTIVDGGYGSDLSLSRMKLVVPEPGAPKLEIEVSGSSTSTKKPYDLDRLVITRDPGSYRFGQVYPVE